MTATTPSSAPSSAPLSAEPDELDFGDVTLPLRLPVRVNGKQYWLYEASGAAAVAYRNACVACTTLGPNGKPSAIRNIADVEPLLVSLCLKDQDERNVSKTTIMQWPQRVQKALYAKVKTISQLDEESAEKLALAAVLALPGAPITMGQLGEWVMKQPETKANKELQSWFKDMPSEELSKNLQSDTMGGSGSQES